MILTALALFAIAGMVFAGGAQSGGSGNAASQTKPTLVIGITTGALVTSYEDNYLTQYLEKLHNINLDFYMLPTDTTESRTKISLMVVSNDLPDMLYTRSLTPETILDYGSKGAFVNLNKYISDPSKAVYFSKIPPDDMRILMNTITMADGNVYGMPNFQPESWNCTPYRIYFNRAWAQKLNIKIPTTTDELRQALIAFRDRDPNGNGQKDEIGIWGQSTGGYGENTTVALINSFVYYNPEKLNLDPSGTKVVAPWVDPGFRKALQYLNTLYRDGVLSAAIFTNDQQTFRATLNASPPVVALTTAGSVSNWAGAGQQDNNANYREMAPILEPLTGPDGVSWAPFNEPEPGIHCFLTTKSKYPDIAFKVIDSGYEPTISKIVRFGEENVDWSQKPEDLAKTTNADVHAGLFPALTLVQLRDIWTKPQNKHWGNIGPRYTPLELGSTVGNLEAPFDPRYFSTTHNAPNYQYYYPRHPEKLLPTLKYTEADTYKVAEPIININDFVRQAIAEFTIGARDINSDAAWNAYLRDLDSMGLQQWLSIAQSTYDRQKR
jgi:putative aldouronate transport system substrate-binding protein